MFSAGRIKKGELKQNEIMFNAGFLNVKRKARKISDVKRGNCIANTSRCMCQQTTTVM